MRRTQTRSPPSKNRSRKSREERMPEKYLDLRLVVQAHPVMEPMQQGKLNLSLQFRCHQNSIRARFQLLTWACRFLVSVIFKKICKIRSLEDNRRSARKLADSISELLNNINSSNYRRTNRQSRMLREAHPKKFKTLKEKSNPLKRKALDSVV